MLLASIAVICGFALLVWGADRFVMGASAVAANLGVAPLIIGLTVVAFGTSAPEILISVVAAWSGNTGLAIGNAIGSNIANVGLVIGVSALIIPLSVHSDTLRREFPILFAIMLLALLLMLDGELSRFDGIVLLASMAVMLYWLVNLGLTTRRSDPIKKEFAAEIPTHMPMSRALTWLFLGLVILFVSSRLLVWGAVDIARFFGVSDLIIGLTIVAIGTSLPELAASVMSAIKKEHDIAIGNVIGSNMFNLLAVMGLPGVIHPSRFDDAVLSRDFPVMFGLTLALFAMAYGFHKETHINRIEGGILLLAYVAYMGVLYHSVSS